ncbi:MAG TPA: pitrilysin family protein, partial [Candidatus Deferrimicrobiaceae bacterium]|nr:pitrilysin family protein [Candidatus Deferrimicrobiaceae bacterium]
MENLSFFLRRHIFSLVICLGSTFCPAQSIPLPKTSAEDVTRSTLPNGLRVVIVRNDLAPVVTVEENYLVGGDETPPGFPGLAHAQEHMAFRGCTNLSADQTAAIFAQLGGDNDADTQQNITQYFETVPSQDLEIALHADADCMRNIDDTQAQWAQERGAIEQEVSRDLSNPTYKFLVRMNHDMFAGTPYKEDALGTRPSFQLTTGAMLKNFQTKWYAPNNAILVITGQVDPAKALDLIKQFYGDIPKKPLPPRPKIDLQPVKAEHFTLPSDYPYTITILAYRMPGSDSGDYAAARVLSDVLASQRADIYGLVPDGKALDAGFELGETYRKAGAALAYAVTPTTANASAMEQTLRSILERYASNGVPPDLVEAAKRSEVASFEFERNSIPGLASLWAQALAAEGRNSPEEDVDAVQKVTVQDVNRVAKEYLISQQAIVATLVPESSGQAVAGKGFGGAEKVTPTPTKAVELPKWAQSLIENVHVPKWNLHPVESTLPNGIDLIVETEPLTPTITITGEIRHENVLEVPPGKEGIATVLDGLFSYGTTSLDRLAFQKALDDIAANESAGEGFELQVLKPFFDRGLQLLAENELSPALPEAAFKIVQQQTAESVAGLLKSPDYRASRSLLQGLLPPGDPALREATPEKISSLTLQDVNNYYKKTFRPDLTKIVVIGDISPEEAKKEIMRNFGSWQTEQPKPELDLPPVPPNKGAASRVPDPARVQDEATLSEEIPMNRFDADYYPLQLGNHILGGGFYATRLYRDLREKTGYVYNVDEELEAGRTRTRFTVSYGADPVNVPKARALIEQDLTAMQVAAPSPEEMAQARAMLIRQIPLGESSESQIADGFLARAMIGLPLDEPIRAAERYEKLSAEEVRAAFAKWIRPEDFV